MVAKVILGVGVLGIGGYVGHTMMSHDSRVYDFPKAQVVSMLEDSRTTLPRRDGPGEIRIWGAGSTSDGVSLKMRYAEWAPTIRCKAVITEVAADKTRVEPDCGGSADSESAIANTQAQLRVPMFAEHIDSTLSKRPFDRSRANAQEMAAVFKNMPDMQREALKRHDEMQRMTADAEANKRSGY